MATVTRAFTLTLCHGVASAPMADVRALTMTSELVEYAVAHGSWPEDPVLRDLREETAALGAVASMQVGADQGQLLTLFGRMLGARRAVEVGTFTGYSSLCIARGLAPGGTLLCCDVSEEWTAIGRRAWERAGLADRIELRIAPAIETLRSLPTEPAIDLAFIDADKGGYPNYWEELAPRVRPGGLLLADNVLWSGRVADGEADEDGDLRAIREFNDRVAADDRVDAVVLPAFDGLTIARRR
jgi:caffeoyl-CoA O-methyltransferase